MSTYTREQIRAAIYRGARHIEQHPHLFSFFRCTIPDCGTPGCAAGWCAHELGIGGMIHEATPILVGWTNVIPDHEDKWRDGEFCDTEFYNRLDSVGPSDWRTNAISCARALRAYADKYFSVEVVTPPSQTISQPTVPWSQVTWKPSALERA